jgi:hypothetical protein
MFVVEKLRMVEIRSFAVGGGALGYGKQFLYGSSAAAALKMFIPLAQGFDDSTSYRFPSLLGDCLRESMGFRVLDV